MTRQVWRIEVEFFGTEDDALQFADRLESQPNMVYVVEPKLVALYDEEQGYQEIDEGKV